MTMPIYPIDAILHGFNEYEDSIVRVGFTTRGVANKTEGCARLRASKPFKRVTAYEQGCANYVWRMICFDLIPYAPHSCMPVCAEFDIWSAHSYIAGKRPSYGAEGYEDWVAGAKKLRAAMDELVDRFVAALPLEARGGIVRWGRALGII